MSQLPSFYGKGNVDLRGPRGEKGEQGEQGQPGPPGAPGRDGKDATTPEDLVRFNDSLALLKSRVDTEIEQRNEDDQAYARRLDTVETSYVSRDALGPAIDAKVEQASEALSTSISAEARAREDLGATLRSETQTLVSGSVETVRESLVSEIDAEARSREALAATLRDETDRKVSASASSVTETLAGQIGAVARDVSAITADYTRGSDVDAKVNAKASEVTQVLTGQIDGVSNQLGAVSGQLGSVASRVSTIEANYVTPGAVTSTVNARVQQEAEARATSESAAARRFEAVESTAGAARSSVTTLSETVATIGGKTKASFNIIADNGAGRARLSVVADGFNGVDIEGDLRLGGNLLLDGSVTRTQVGKAQITYMQVIRSGDYPQGTSQLKEVLRFNLSVPETSDYVFIANTAIGYFSEAGGYQTSFVLEIDGIYWGESTSYSYITGATISRAMKDMAPGNHLIRLLYSGTSSYAGLPELIVFGAYR